VKGAVKVAEELALSFHVNQMMDVTFAFSAKKDLHPRNVFNVI
jgi:hypothetical protein